MAFLSRLLNEIYHENGGKEFLHGSKAQSIAA